MYSKYQDKSLLTRFDGELQTDVFDGCAMICQRSLIKPLYTFPRIQGLPSDLNHSVWKPFEIFEIGISNSITLLSLYIIIMPLEYEGSKCSS